MRQVTSEEHKEMMSIFKKEITTLAKHESKNFYFGQVAINLCYTRRLNEAQTLFQAFTPGFIRIIDNYYIEALKNSPKCFGTGDANDILYALPKEAIRHGWVWDIERYKEYMFKNL